MGKRRRVNTSEKHREKTMARVLDERTVTGQKEDSDG